VQHKFDRSRPANIVLPSSTIQLVQRRATERWGKSTVEAGRDWVLVWASRPTADQRPIGAFAVSWGVPYGCEATISQLAWDDRRACADDVRRAINQLAGWPVAWQESAPAA
jgi:hypothetical protein